jgi:hypothetical protein
MVAQFDRLNLIQKNFIQLNFVMKHQNPYVITDKPAMTADGLLSNVGGSLSLWLGMTVMFVFEIVEFIYSLVSDRHSRQKEKTMTATKENENENENKKSPGTGSPQIVFYV